MDGKDTGRGPRATDANAAFLAGMGALAVAIVEAYSFALGRQGRDLMACLAWVASAWWWLRVAVRWSR